MAQARVSMGELMGGVIVHLEVTGIKRARLRAWLGIHLMRLGAWVTGVTVDVRLESQDDIGLTADGLPRALSVIEGRRGYRRDAIFDGVGLVIKLDGIERRDVVSYDIDAGRIAQFVRNPDGSFVCPTLNGSPLIHHFKGVVTVERAP